MTTVRSAMASIQEMSGAINRAANIGITDSEYELQSSYDEQPPLLGQTVRSCASRLQLRQFVKDFTGVRIGKLYVIGLYQWAPKIRHIVWVVRCDCGTYELRRHNRLKGNLKHGRNACCQRCFFTKYPNGHADKKHSSSVSRSLAL